VRARLLAAIVSLEYSAAASRLVNITPSNAAIAMAGPPDGMRHRPIGEPDQASDGRQGHRNMRSRIAEGNR
jgi:hypothetical protein